MKTYKVIYTLIFEDGKIEIKETTIQLKRWNDEKAISEVFWKRDWEGDVAEIILEKKELINS
jgi:hypothetical protein